MTLCVDIVALGNTQRTLLRGLRFEVPPGAVLTLMGPSGCGKSSVLAAIAGTLDSGAEDAEPLRLDGSIRLNGVDLCPVPAARRGVGLLFQDALLFPISRWPRTCCSPCLLARAHRGGRGCSRHCRTRAWPASATAIRPRSRAGNRRVWP